MEFLLLVVAVLVIPAVIRSWLQGLNERQKRAEFIDGLRGRLLRASGAPVELEGSTAIPFQLAGRKARLSLPEAEGRTVLRVGDHGRPAGRLHVFESGGHAGARDVEDLRVGDPHFDRAWIVQGSLARLVFSPESRAEVIAAVSDLRRYYDPCVEIDGEVLSVSVGQNVDSEAAVRALLKAAGAVLEALGSRGTEGLLWIEVREDAAAVCQVCGTDAVARTVRCGSCRTPHHEDCWRYVGRCSTYGCGGRELARKGA